MTARGRAAETAGSRPPAAGAAEKLTEDVVRAEAELPENVADIEIAEDVFLAVALVKTRLAELIVLLALIRVGKHGVGLGDLLELFLGLLIAGVFVGMVFEGQLAVGFFDFIGRGVLGNPEDAVIILGHGIS